MPSRCGITEFCLIMHVMSRTCFHLSPINSVEEMQLCVVCRRSRNVCRAFGEYFVDLEVFISLSIYFHRLIHRCHCLVCDHRAYLSHAHLDLKAMALDATIHLLPTKIDPMFFPYNQQ